jgi:acyl-CoA reductase-like NAD-dependent aldehyde dehydrogenase
MLPNEVAIDNSEKGGDETAERRAGGPSRRGSSIRQEAGIACDTWRVVDDAMRGRNAGVLGTAPSRLPAIVARAQAAAGPWGNLSFRQRTKSLVRLRALVSRQEREIAQMIACGTGKSLINALLFEVARSLDTLDACIGHATDDLADQPAAAVGALAGLLGAYGAVLLPCSPCAVVGVIAPVSSPFERALTPAVLALAAGNALIVNPSSSVPQVARLIEFLFDEALADFPGLVQVVHGSAAVGAALTTCEGVDAVVCTESTDLALARIQT